MNMFEYKDLVQALTQDTKRLKFIFFRWSLYIRLGANLLKSYWVKKELTHLLCDHTTELQSYLRK